MERLYMFATNADGHTREIQVDQERWREQKHSLEVQGYQVNVLDETERVAYRHLAEQIADAEQDPADEPDRQTRSWLFGADKAGLGFTHAVEMDPDRWPDQKRELEEQGFQVRVLENWSAHAVDLLAQTRLHQAQTADAERTRARALDQEFTDADDTF